MAADSTAIIDRALGYPYTPPTSGLIYNTASRTSQDWDGAPLPGDRTPVLALGSNAAPQQLARKYDGDFGHIAIARATLTHFDVAHAAQFSNYGAVPATLAPMPNAQVDLYVTFLDAAQLPVMHATEDVGFHYDYTRLTRLELTTEFGNRLDTAYCYVARRGALSSNGQLLALAERSATGSTAARVDQRSIQDHCRSLLADHLELDEFVHGTATNRQTRDHRADSLAPHALPFAYDHAEIVNP